MDKKTKDLKDIPVSVIIAVFTIFVFSMYFTTAIKQLPCNKDIVSNFYSNFVHVDTYHLTVNMFVLYSISRVEEQIGSQKFFTLVAFLLVLNAVLMTLVHKVNDNVTCSIGLSGVLFGLITWELTSNKGINPELLLSIIIMVIVPSLKTKKVSLVGHVVGAVSGIIGGLLWKKFVNGD